MNRILSHYKTTTGQSPLTRFSLYSLSLTRGTALGGAPRLPGREQQQRGRFHASARGGVTRTLRSGLASDTTRSERKRQDQPERDASAPGQPKQPHTGEWTAMAFESVTTAEPFWGKRSN